MAEKFFVTAILVSHDGASWLPEAIAALSSQTRPIDRIMAVDTGSTDSSVKMLIAAGITVLKANRNDGFGDAIALALGSIKKLVSSDAEELIWILHDDCAPDKGALQILIEALSEKPQIAFVGPKLLGWYNRRHLLEIGISVAGNGARWTGLDPREHDQGQFDQSTEVLAVSTAAMLARLQIFEDLGGLDPNLALFRDDVDLGWRARVAGFSVVTAPSALVYHAEASASERRSVDVEEAFLHRPRLLDRKNAAFVLMANSSWWLLPWIAIQIVGSATLRASGYLLAKLPGYAADEIAAVGLLIIKPRELIRARKWRKQKRLLPPRVVREFIPPVGIQVRMAFTQGKYSIRNFFKGHNYQSDKSDNVYQEETFSDFISYADIGVIDESFDDQDITFTSQTSLWRTIRNRPLLIGMVSIFLISVIASRNRFGTISGGALAVSPGGAMDLIAKYSESWHLVGMGSTAPMPPWVALVAGFSAITFGKVWLFISLIFLFTPPLAFYVMYRSAKSSGLGNHFAVAGGILYAMSPAIWNSINQGRLGTLVIAVLAPGFLALASKLGEINLMSWRKIYGMSILTAILAAFSPLFLIAWTLFFLVYLGVEVFKKKDKIKEAGAINFGVATSNSRIRKIITLLLLPGLLNAPWSASLVIHPTQIFLEPGLPLTGGSLLSILSLNPGGDTGVPVWIMTPFIVFLLLTLFSKKYAIQSSLAVGVLSFSVLISQINVVGHGSNGNIWTGSLIIFIEVLILIPALTLASNMIENLRNSKLGLRHWILVTTAVFASSSVFVMSTWAITGGSHSLVGSEKVAVVPPFIASLSNIPERPKTLVLKRSGNQLVYFITRGSDLEIGDADVAVAMPKQIRIAIDDLVSGVGLESNKVLGAYGIGYVFLRNPADDGVVRTIDGIGGFSRNSATRSGIIWQVAGSRPRVSVVDAAGKIAGLNSSNVGAIDELQTPGVITLAEKFNSGWKLIVNGNDVKLAQSELGMPSFEVQERGSITLLHDGTRRRALISMQLISLIVVIVLSLPAGRRRKEVPVEELA